MAEKKKSEKVLKALQAKSIQELMEICEGISIEEWKDPELQAKYQQLAGE